MARKFDIVLFANDDEKRAKGLMNTDPLSESECALFSFARRADHPFWNKNVSYPLALAFVDDRNRVLAIRKMDAESTDACRADSPDVKFVVEAAVEAMDGISEGDILMVDGDDMSVWFVEP